MTALLALCRILDAGGNAADAAVAMAAALNVTEPWCVPMPLPVCPSAAVLLVLPPPPPPKKKSSSPLPSPATGPFTDLHFPPPPPLPNTNGVAVSLAQQALEETASACTLMPQQKRCMDSMDLGVLLPSSASTTFEVWASPKTRSARAMPAFCCVLWKLPLLAFPPLP